MTRQSVCDNVDAGRTGTDRVVQALGLDLATYELASTLPLKGPIRDGASSETYLVGCDADLLIRVREPCASASASPQAPDLLLHARVLLVGTGADGVPLVVVVA